MDLLKLGTDLLVEQFQGKVSADNASSALLSLMGDGAGGLDIGAIVAKIASNGQLSSMVSSWLGDGGNETINPNQLLDVFGSEKLSQFSSTLGQNQDNAIAGLSTMLPNLLDKSSSGGKLLESVGGIGGALNMAKKFF